MYISFTSIEYYIPDPLTAREDVEKASRILIAADNDVYEDYDASHVIIHLIGRKVLWSEVIFLQGLMSARKE